MSNKRFIIQRFRFPKILTCQLKVFNLSRGREMRRVQISCDICTRFARYLYSTKQCWIINMGYRPSVRSRCSFFHKHAKNTQGQYPAILTEQAWSIKDLNLWDTRPKHDKFSLWDKARIPSGQDSSILPAWVANHSTRFGSSCPLMELVI